MEPCPGGYPMNSTTSLPPLRARQPSWDERLTMITAASFRAVSTSWSHARNTIHWHQVYTEPARCRARWSSPTGNAVRFSLLGDRTACEMRSPWRTLSMRRRCTQIYQETPLWMHSISGTGTLSYWNITQWMNSTDMLSLSINIVGPMTRCI